MDALADARPEESASARARGPADAPPRSDRDAFDAACGSGAARA
jgi:hypothetical protein